MACTQVGSPWASVAGALRAFVAEDDAALDAACHGGGAARAPAALADAPAALAADVSEPVCARHNLGCIATYDATFAEWAAAHPESAAHLARGLRRWFVWVGEVPAEGPQRAWLAKHGETLGL